MRRFVIAAVALAVGLGTAASPFASSAPDGLNRVAEDEGFAGDARPSRVQHHAPVDGYAFPGIADERAARGLAGFAGTLALFGISAGAGAALRRRPGRPAAAHAGPCGAGSGR